MTESLLGELQDTEARQAVIDSTLALFKRWQLHEVNQSQLLGVSSISTLKRQSPDKLEMAVFTRMGNILAIDRALQKHFCYEPKNRDNWILQSQEELKGETPLDIMLTQGDKGIRKIKQLAESLSEY